jgi:hypothetical protein
MKKTLIPLLILVLSNMVQAAEVDISSYTIGIEGSKTLLFGNYTTIEFSPQFEFTEYSNSEQNDPTRRFGLDSYIDYGRNHSFDLGIGLAQFTSSVTKESEQKDLLLIYTNKYFRKTSIRCGLHNVSTDNKDSLNVNTGIAGHIICHPMMTPLFPHTRLALAWVSLLIITGFTRKALSIISYCLIIRCLRTRNSSLWSSPLTSTTGN